ncbi:type II toxin-antitoxin system VapC family toxin [Sphingomonas sp. SUN039]|uniref:type II toxin-antitoxin system VapC family toxin n=1 Tax=Sphingomonas sp. SUN039 TaxID=2937787 RepID=UPI0021642584|nr:type II toxin-antitoxin system VapC family toxin [Sphingomonas sp. SUN039]UVO55561.1 type II toxin-antitoxin system VapC family toxin [Sphingomonas sp. SUN039]
MARRTAQDATETAATLTRNSSGDEGRKALVAIYLDASVVVPLFADEARTELVQAFLTANDEALRISDFTALEVASAFSRLVRERVYTDDDAHNALTEFDRWRDGAAQMLPVETADIAMADGFVRRFDTKLRPGDALHLAVATRRDCRVVTADRAMAAAAALLQVDHLLLGEQR